MIAAKDVTIASQEGNLFAFANTDFQIRTSSGVVSLKAGDKLDMRSAKAMTIKTEADGLNMISIGAVTETFSSTLTSTVTGAVSETFSAGQTTTVDGSLVMSGSSGVNVSSSGAINITASGVAAISGSSVTNNGIAQLGPGVT